MFKNFLFLCLFIFEFNLIQAQDKITTDQPGQTQSAALTPPHYFQGEFGFQSSHLDDKNYDVLLPTVLLKYGLTKNFELRLENDFLLQYRHYIPQTKKVTGFEPLEIGFRTAICEQNKVIPQTSLITQFAIPTVASKNFKAKHLAPVILLAMQNDVTQSLQIQYNIGAEWDGLSTTPDWLYSVNFGFELSKKFDAFAEVFGSAANKSIPENSIDGGFGYYINNDIKLDAFAGFGISNAAANYFFGTGLSFRIK